MSSVIAPPRAMWVGLDQQVGDEWVRVEQPQLRADRNDPKGIWWDRKTVDPIAIAAQLGGGVFRVHFAPNDRRNRIMPSQAIEVAAAPGVEPSQPAELEDESDEDDLEDGDEGELEDESDDEGELEDEPANARQLPLPNVAPPPARPAPAPRPAPRAAARPMPRAPAPRPFSPPPAAATLGPLETLIYLNQMAESQYARNHELMFGAMSMMLETANQRAAETLAFERQRSEQLLAMQREHTERMTRELAIARAPSPQAAEMVQAINTLASRVDELQAGDEDDDAMQAQLARLSDNPNDTERIVAGVQNVISAVLSSPVGPAIAQAIGKRFGLGAGAEAAMPPAAE